MASTNDFLVKLLAQLDTSSINPEYEKLKKRLTNDPIIQKVTLDTSMSKQAIKTMATEIHNELGKAFKATGIEDFDITVKDVESILSSAVKESNKLAKELESASSKAQKFLAQFNNKSGGTLVNSKEFKAVQDAINGLGKTSSIDDLNKAMNTLETTYNNMVSNLRNGGKSLNPFINAINDMKNMDSTLKGIELDFQSLSSRPKAVSDAIKELYVQQSKVNQYSQGTVEWSREYGILQGKIVAVKNEIQNVSKAEKASNTDESNKVKYYQRIIDNNKTIYSLKNKLLTADVKQTEEIDKQIVKLEKRNQYNYSQLNKKGLTDNSWEQIVNGSKDALSSQLRINSAKQEDIANTKALAQAEKERTAALKEQQLLASQANKIQLSTDVTKLTTDYQKFGIVSQEVENNLKELKLAQEAVVNAKGTDRLATEIEKYDTALAKAKSSWKELSATQVSLNQRTSQMTSMQEWMHKNSAATKLCGDRVKELIAECQTCNKVRFDQIKNEFKQIQVEAGKAGKLGVGTLEGIITQGKKFVQWVSVSGATMGFFNDIRQSISEIKELDNILTEISKTSNMTTQELKKLGMAAYDSASKYGRTASDYLTGVQEMSRSGFYGEKGTAMAEQSLLAQAAGDMSAELANNYILATNAAYKLNGEAEKLNAVLDGQNSITNRNSVAMEDMATAMSEAGTVASSYRVSVEDLSAMIGTIESVTKLGGSEVGNGIKSILINLQNISSSKITSTLDKANASMTEFVNGTEQLRNPISILRDLAKTFDTLEESDPLRAEILSNIGGKYQAPKLAALLQNMTLFDKMLVDYSEGSGSAMEEAQKSANNLTGSINTLSNSWTEFVNTIVNSDGLKTGVNLLNSLVQGATSLVEVLSPLGTAALIGGGILGAKNAGREKCYPSYHICL